jgi:transcriptional regulator GlxA family with amidase domain
MVEEDFGHTIALDVARRLVVFLKRPGGQSQFSTVLAAQASDVEGRFSALHAWISAARLAAIPAGESPANRGVQTLL